MTPPVLSDPKLRLLEAVAREPSITRAEARSRAALYFSLALIPMIAVLFIAGGPGHAAGRPFTMTVVISIGCVVLAAIATALTTKLSTSSAPQRSGWLSRSGRALLGLAAVGIPVALALWITAFHDLYEDPFQRLGVRCFLLALAAAPWPFAAMIGWRTIIDPHHPALLGAAFGAAAGAWSGVVVVLWCPLSDVGHVARGHLLPFVVFVGAGAWVGARLFGLKSR